MVSINIFKQLCGMEGKSHDSMFLGICCVFAVFIIAFFLFLILSFHGSTDSKQKLARSFGTSLRANLELGSAGGVRDISETRRTVLFLKSYTCQEEIEKKSGSYR